MTPAHFAARTAKILLVTLAGAIALPVAYLTALRLSGNFHVVAPGEVYRSAQPGSGDLSRYARTIGIRSVINLREMPEDKQNPYAMERAEAEALGLTYVQYPLPSGRLLNAAEITGVIKALADAPKPVLIHSYWGADRAGIASALYLLRIAGKPAGESSVQLSPRFGHLPYLGNPTSAMDQSFAAVVSVSDAGS